MTKKKDADDNTQKPLYKRILRGLWKTLKWTMIIFFSSSVLMVIIYKWVPVPYTPLMFIRNVQQTLDGKESRTEHNWVPIEDISPELPLAVWASEDQNFFNHNGFDFEAIANAYLEAQNGGRQRGGSTITQQTAKNVFLWPQSSWIRKGFEAYFTVLIELFWSKERIMEVYLNSIEMGDGIYGAEAVAQIHFGTSAKKLTRQQSAMIAASLPNPLKFNSAKPTPYMYKRQKWIIRQMKHLGKFPTK